MIRCPVCGAILAIHANGFAICGVCQKKMNEDPAYGHSGIYRVQIEEMEKQYGPQSKK